MKLAFLELKTGRYGLMGNKENYLEHPIPAAPIAPPGQQVPPQALEAHDAWVKGQKEFVVLMLLTMDLKIQQNLAHLGAYDMLRELKATYSKQPEQELCRLFMHNYNMHDTGKSVNELHAMLKLHEERLPKKDVNPALHAIRAGRVQKNNPHKAAKGVHGKGKGKIGYALTNALFAPKAKTPLPPKKDKPTKDAICHQCGEFGHWRRNYPVYLAELMKKKKLSQGASTLDIFTIELYSFPSKSWIYDTGCGTHICITTQSLRGSKKMKPGALSLYMGDGPRVAIEAIGTYHLELPSGLVIVLNNFHYASSITRFLRNNLVYFMAVPRDGIFEIDMSCSNTNDSSIKMARKPYSHQVERAKDLLRLIHTDVFQKEVENQLGKTIKSLRSDRGGEYMSQEFLDHLKEYRIIDHPTPPYTPQNNKVSEKRNRTLLDMVYQSPFGIMLLRLLYAFSTWFQLRSTSDNKVFVAQNVELFEFKLLDLKASGSVEDLELIQEEDINPSVDTSLNHEEDDQEIDEPQRNNIPMLQDLKSYLGRSFTMKDLGEAAYIFGSRSIVICQREKVKLSKSQAASTPTGKQRMQNIPHASAVGSIMYVVRNTRLDVAFAQNITSHFQQNPGEEHWTAAKNILKYLRNTKDMFLTGYVFILNGGAVDWKSIKQSIFATSSTDAEYIATFDASKEAVWIREFIFRLGIVPTIEEHISMYSDNTGAIAIAKDDGVTKGARHFHAKVHYLCKTIKFGDVKIEKIDTDDNLDDPFTKALAFPKHSELTKNIGLLPASSFIFVQNYNMHGMGKTVNELHAMLKLHEETLPKKDANPALHAIRAGRVQKNQKNKLHRAGKGSHGKGKGMMGNASSNASFASKPKTSPPPKKDNPAKDAICHQCGEVGH
nr:hypothetical protein [Tanacetum cinerariifolium]